MTEREMKADLEKCVKILELKAEIEHKYKQFYFYSIEGIKRVLEICTKYGVNLSDCDEYGFKYNHGFNFIFTQEYCLTSSHTNYNCAHDEWYVHLKISYDRFNLTSDVNPDVYAATGDIWKDFTNVIFSYEPLDHDDLNCDYIFSVKNGYRLWKDLDGIYKDYCKRFLKELEQGLKN